MTLDASSRKSVNSNNGSFFSHSIYVIKAFSAHSVEDKTSDININAISNSIKKLNLKDKLFTHKSIKWLLILVEDSIMAKTMFSPN